MMSAEDFLAEVKRSAEAWPSEEPLYMQYASTELILSGNYDDAVREGFDAGVEWAEHANRDRTLRLVAALEAVLALHVLTRYGDLVGNVVNPNADVLVCPSCDDGSAGYPVFPCPTVRAIEEALEEGKGQ